MSRWSCMHTQSSQRKNEVSRSSGLDLSFAQNYKTLFIPSLSRHVNRVENQINRYNKIKGCHIEEACILNHLGERTKFLGPLDWIYPLHKITRLSPFLPSLVMWIEWKIKSIDIIKSKEVTLKLHAYSIKFKFKFKFIGIRIKYASIQHRMTRNG